MKSILTSLILTLLLISCKEKKKPSNPGAQFFPVNSYIKGQVAQMDSSLANIIKVERINNGAPDTSYIQAKEFKKYAKEFLDLPDISSKELKDEYEVNNSFDDLMNMFVFTYTTTNPDLEIKKQDVLLDPGEDGKSDIQTINIDKWETRNDSIIHKNMVWDAGKRFLIVTKAQKNTGPESFKTLEVRWDNFRDNQ